MPGNNPAMLLSADILGADAVILDLEDAVSLEEKDAARTLVRNALRTLEFERCKVMVRVNPIDSPFWKADLDAIIPAKPDYLMIPKADPETMAAFTRHIEKLEAEHSLPETKYFLLIEFPASIVNLVDIIKMSDRTKGIVLGAEDYSSYLGVNRTKESAEILYPRQVIATVGKAFGLETVDTPFTDVSDAEGLKSDTAFVKGIGFTGKLCINPRQVDVVHQVLNPTQKEIEESLEIVALNEKAKQEGLGVFSYKGKMVDLPVVNRANTTLEKAKRWGLV